MIDERLDKNLQEFNRRYQELVYSKEMSSAEKKNRYFGNIKDFNIKRIVQDLKYRNYAIENFTVSGNMVLENVQYQDVSQLKIAVYSCIVGSYDRLIEPVFVEPGVDYLMFTDQEIPEFSSWKKIDITRMEEYGELSNSMMNRKIKIMQCSALQEYDYTIYIDGNIEVVSGVSPIITDMGRTSFGVHYHRRRDCIYDEVISVKHLKRIKGEEMDQQMRIYKKDGFPRHFGMFENSILIRDNRDDETLELMREWWDEFCRFPTRDQLSLPYVIWKQGYSREKILILGNDVERNTRFNRINKHL